MKRLIDKTLTAVLVIIILLNFIFPTIVLADPLMVNPLKIKMYNEFDEFIYSKVKDIDDIDEPLIFSDTELNNLRDSILNEIEEKREGLLSEELMALINAELEDGFEKDFFLSRNGYEKSGHLYAYIKDKREMTTDEFRQNVIEIKDEFPQGEEPIIAFGFDDFRNKVREFIEEKFSTEEFQSDYAKMKYLIVIKTDGATEILNMIYGNLPDYEQYRIICIEVADEMLKDFEHLETIAIDEAITRFNELLKEIKNIWSNNHEDLDEEALNLGLKEEFNALKNKYLQKEDDDEYHFYKKTMEIAEKILLPEDKVPEKQEKFIKNVPQYMDSFLSSASGIITVYAEENIWDMLSVSVDGIAGILIWPVRVLFIVVPGAVIQLVESLLANVGSEQSFRWLTIDKIFFNNLPLTDIDIFNFEQAAGSTISANNVLFKIRQNVAGWYYAIRNLCIALSFALLVYMGIRMAISSVADERAKYKKMLKDWAVSLALIFVLHYFMIFVITANNQLVAAFDKTRIDEEEIIAAELQLGEAKNIQDQVLEETMREKTLVKGMAYSLLYLMLVAMTLLFLILYIKRMVTLCILAMLAPIITVTYALDKAGDGKAQALGKWMSEFVFNILIQPFHCIIYMVFLQNIFYVIGHTNGIAQVGKIVVAVMLLGFVYKAEDIVKSIFGFKTSSLSSAAVLGATAFSKVQSAASKGKGIKNAGKLASGARAIKNPKSLPSSARNVPSGTSAPSNSKPQSSSNSNKKPNRAVKLAKGTVNAYKNASHKTGRFLANHVLASAMAYGMTGDAVKAYGAHELVGNAKNRINRARDNGAIRNRKELTRDAYQDYAEHKGLGTAAERESEMKRLMNADPSTLTDPAEKNMVEWLNAEKQMYEMMGSKDPMKDVLKNLQDYEDEQI